MASSTLGHTLERADAALYEAKHQGRNRINLAPMSQSMLEESLLSDPDDSLLPLIERFTVQEPPHLFSTPRH